MSSIQVWTKYWVANTLFFNKTKPINKKPRAVSAQHWSRPKPYSVTNSSYNLTAPFKRLEKRDDKIADEGDSVFVAEVQTEWRCAMN